MFFQDGEAFEQTLDAYVRKFLVKGIPSLFSDLKGLYRYYPLPLIWQLLHTCYLQLLAM